MWLPDLKSLEHPYYVGLANKLKRAIENGTLHQGERLPTHRDMSDHLGVTPGTVTKAYNIVESEGLIVSRVGRGTYVGKFPESILKTYSDPVDFIDLRYNNSLIDPFNRELNSILGSISRRKSLHGLFEYHPGEGAVQHRAAGANWMKLRGVDIEPDSVLISDNVWVTIVTLLASFSVRHETVLTENLNILGLQRLAKIYQLKLRGISSDREGLLPQEIVKAGKKEHVGAILCSPTMHDPINSTMSLKRRMEIIQTARELNCFIIENDNSGHLADDETQTIATLAPDITIYICGLAKSLAPGLRIGLVGTGTKTVPQLQDAMRAMPWASSTLMGEVASSLINGRTGSRLLRWHREDALRRQKIAAQVLKRSDCIPPFPSYHIWLTLPPPWRAQELCQKLENNGVLVYPALAFAINGNNVPEAVRICIGGVSKLERLAEGLSIIVDTIDKKQA